MVAHDFLEHVVGRPTIDRFLVSSNGQIKCRREHYKPKNPHRPMMPIEFAAAAYRFGHSMVRGGYEEGERLGPVGGRIVAETILGILDHDGDSYFHERGWTPPPPIASTPGECRIGHLLDFANRD